MAYCVLISRSEVRRVVLLVVCRVDVPSVLFCVDGDNRLARWLVDCKTAVFSTWLSYSVLA